MLESDDVTPAPRLPHGASVKWPRRTEDRKAPWIPVACGSRLGMPAALPPGDLGVQRTVAPFADRRE